MRNPHILFFLCLVLSCWPGALAAAPNSDENPARTPAGQAPGRDQYNNSTVYNGDVYTTHNNDAYNGFAGTWRDPETGDIITSVIAPRQPQPGGSAPIIVAPQVYPDSYQPRPPYPPYRPYPPRPQPPYRPYPPGPPPRPYPTPGPSPVPPWQQPGWQGTAPPQGYMPPGWRPPNNQRPWPHAPGYTPVPRNNVTPPAGMGGQNGSFARPGFGGAR